MKFILLAVAVVGLIEARSISELRGLDRNDKWFDGIRDLATKVIVDHFKLEAVKDLVKQNVEHCMQQADVTECMKDKVDAVSDALGDDVSPADRDDAKIKVAALSDFLAAVHGSCADKSDEELGKCAFEEGERFCGASDFDKKECMGGIIFVLRKAKELANGGKKRGLARDDKWFDGLRDLATNVIVDHFDLEGVKDLVKESVEHCMQQDDVTECMEGKVDAVSDALGDDVSKADRDDAKIKVAALSDFLAAVHGSCADKSDEELGKCAYEEGKRFCGASDFDKKDCMKGVMFVLGKAKEMATGGKKRGLARDDKWFDGLRDLATNVIVDHFDLEGVRDLVKQSVEHCMQQDDVTKCMEGKVDAVSDALGDDVSQADRDDAKIKVAALSDFLAAVHGSCADKSDEELGKCAYEEGKRFCGASDFDKKDCMGGVMFVLGKAKKMAAGGKKRGLARDDKWFDGLRDLATNVIVDHFDLEGVRGLVKESVEHCMQQDDVTECMKGKVDAVSDALGDDVSQADRDDAKIKVAALSDFLAAVHGSCADKSDEELGKCAFEEGKRFCGASDFDKKECMGGVKFVLEKAKDMA